MISLNEKSCTCSHISYRPDIDGLRAFAVLFVVIYHAWPSALPGGFVGVDIFFVISGFLISSIIFRGVEQRSFSFKSFYAKRIRRIFPALIVVFAACLLMGWFALLADEYQMLGKHVASGAVFISNFTLVKESGYFDAAAELKPLLHLWSLGIEEQFYIVWPLLIFTLAKLRINLLVVTVFVAILSFSLNIWGIDAHLVETFYYPYTRFWELMLGAILAHILLYSGETFKSKLKSSANFMALLGLVLVISSLILLDRNKLFPGWWAALPTLGTVLLIAAGPEAWINKKVLALRPLVFVGLISYPLYLWHWPLLSFVRIIESSDPAPFLIPIVIFVSFCLAWLTYAVVEKRLRYHHSGWVVIGLILVVALLGAGGKVIQLNSGLPDRPSVAHYKDFESQLVREPSTDSVCVDYIERLGVDRLFYYCRSSNLQNEKWLAIIGDSHAHVLFPGFSEEASKRGYGTILIANSGCPPLVGTAKGKTETERRQCSDKINQIFRVVSLENRIAKVLLSTRGPVSLSGHGFGVAEKAIKNVPIYSFPENSMSDDVPDEIFFTGLENTINKMQSQGKEITYFLENPELGLRPKDCLGRPLVFVNKQPDFQVDLDVYRARMKDYRNGVFQVANNSPDFKILDPEPLFCDDQVCRGILNGKLMYADDDHLSVMGSKYVASELAPFLFNK